MIWPQCFQMVCCGHWQYNTCWCFNYTQTVRKGHSGWRWTHCPFLRPALSKKKKKKSLLRVLYICTYLKIVYFFNQCNNSEFMLAYLRRCQTTLLLQPNSQKKNVIVSTYMCEGRDTFLPPDFLQLWRMRFNFCYLCRKQLKKETILHTASTSRFSQSFISIVNHIQHHAAGHVVFALLNPFCQNSK